MKSANLLYFLCLFISSLLFSFAGCVSYPTSLNTNFQLAGKNKSDLKIVVHDYSAYQADSKKRKASNFLTENMEMYEFYSGKARDSYQTEPDSETLSF